MLSYLANNNLLPAAALSAIVSAMSIGRVLAGGRPFFSGVAMVFMSMTLVCAAVTAWGRRAGMAGAWTDAGTLRRGLLAALTLGLALWPAFLVALDPRTRDALGGAANGDALRLAFPPTRGAGWRWSCGWPASRPSSCRRRQ
jgi:hypothetical protein